MIQGIYSATSGMVNSEIMLEVITNNLANVSTTGYKRDDLSFSGMLNPLPSANVSALHLVSQSANLDGTTAKFVTDFTQGELQRTDNPLDLALDGEGFLVIQHAKGIRYARGGSFSRDNAGQLVTADGYPVLGTNGTIQIQSGQVDIDGAGQVTVNGIPVDKLRLVDFQDKKGLIKDGENTFVITDTNSTEEPAACEARQGFLELSNVSPVHEMVKMIECMRVYESYQKTVQSIHETLKKANEELGKISV